MAGGVEMVRKIIRDRERNGQMKMEEIDEHKYRKIIYFIDTTRNNNSSS